jgi:hypothetical protein
VGRARSLVSHGAATTVALQAFLVHALAGMLGDGGWLLGIMT